MGIRFTGAVSSDRLTSCPVDGVSYQSEKRHGNRRLAPWLEKEKHFAVQVCVDMLLLGTRIGIGIQLENIFGFNC